MDAQLPSLDSLGRKFGTDKSSEGHDYLAFYETLLQGMRHQDVRILEVGILFGASLRMWQEYFPNGTIIGADIHPGVKSLEGERIVTEIVDQGNLEDLARLCTRHGPFDIVVEDGSHMWEHQITTFKTVFPFVRESGIFIIEDLHTNFGALQPHYCGISSISCMDYLQKLVALKVADDQLDVSAEEDPFLRTYGRVIESITFLKRACVIRKGRHSGTSDLIYMPGFEAPDAASSPLIGVSNGRELLPLCLACHIGTIGDWYSHTGSLKSLDDDNHIQGFVLFPQGFPAKALEYRARLGDGTWTEWVSCGNFVGTMGVAQALTGYSARLAQGASSVFTLRLVGLFRGQTDPVRVGQAEECVPDSSTGELYGMQCLLQRR
jgi:hypothetical protein